MSHRVRETIQVPRVGPVEVRDLLFLEEMEYLDALERAEDNKARGEVLLDKFLAVAIVSPKLDLRALPSVAIECLRKEVSRVNKIEDPTEEIPEGHERVTHAEDTAEGF